MIHTHDSSRRSKSLEKHSFPLAPVVGKVYQRILSEAQNSPGQLFVVIDPPDHTPDQVSKIASSADKAGASAFAVGGSLGAQGRLLDETIESIKKED